MDELAYHQIRSLLDELASTDGGITAAVDVVHIWTQCFDRVRIEGNSAIQDTLAGAMSDVAPGFSRLGEFLGAIGHFFLVRGGFGLVTDVRAGIPRFRLLHPDYAENGPYKEACKNPPHGVTVRRVDRPGPKLADGFGKPLVFDGLGDYADRLRLYPKKIKATEEFDLDTVSTLVQAERKVTEIALLKMGLVPDMNKFFHLLSAATIATLRSEVSQAFSQHILPPLLAHLGGEEPTLLIG